MTAVLSSALPPLYAGWMKDLLGGTIPDEAPSTCSDCAMCTPAAGRADSTLVYNPATKCCTYLPRMWNFLAGRVLTDHTPDAAAGRATLEARLDAGMAVTPLGLEQTPLFNHLYAQAKFNFGRVESLRCPHYLAEAGGLCGVWRHRESTCATWFCKHERGRVSERLFDALHALLKTAEQTLARWVVIELDIGLEALELLLPINKGSAPPMTAGDFDGVPDRALQRRRWGRWAGREREFYAEAARLVGMLKWSDVRTIAGPELQIQERLVQEDYRLVGDLTVPSRLKAQPLKLEDQGPDSSQVGTYSHLDPLSLPNVLIGVLHYFDGRSTDDALRAIAREERLELEPALVRRLADFGILRPPGPE